ncbi:MAG: YhjD/YihY/BrkB family envelope integrity protein [Nitrospirales bacterium]
MPRHIPKPGWWDILVRVKDQISSDNVSLVAAGVAFYGIVALFPALAAIVSLYGLINDPQEVQQQIQSVSAFLPHDAQAREVLLPLILEPHLGTGCIFQVSTSQPLVTPVSTTGHYDWSPCLNR